MTAGERGFLLLSSHLGNPDRKPLTTAQLRDLTHRMRQAERKWDSRQIEPRDLTQLGCKPEIARRIVALLEQEELLDSYLRRCKAAGCGVLTRISAQYPHALRRTLGPEAPGCLWYKGDLSILSAPKAALVGSRNILPKNAQFARQAGIQAASQGFALVSGNARGADTIAQDACLQSGGKVISVVADGLQDHPASENILFISEDGFDIPFSAPRALSRNRIIHALASVVLVAQTGDRTGGTWHGTAQNLRQGWSRVYCFDDGSAGSTLLSEMGARLTSVSRLKDLAALAEREQDLSDNI